MSDYLNKSKSYKEFHYSVLSNDEIEYLHHTTLQMLKIIIPVFEKNDIRYMICGGTLLGSVTTQKFIPWDEDIDICVPEEDYDKMIACMNTSMPDWMCFQWNNTEPHYYHGWVKIRDKNSHVFPDAPLYQYNGVWIDIYKLVKVPRGRVNYLVLKEHSDYLNRRCAVGDISAAERDKRISEHKLTERIEKEIAAFQSLENLNDTVYVIMSASKVSVEEEWIFPRKKYIFENMELFSFKEADHYLRNHYGNEYMKQPPDEMRRVGINKIIYKA